MHVSWGDILVCLFMHLRLVLLISLILFIVIFGRLLLLAFQDLNIIWSYLMIALTICGLFPYVLSLTLSSLSNFTSYATTQFGASVKEVQCDNGKEFDNSSTRTFFLTRGIHLHMSCPYTSPQNGKAEHSLHK